LPQHCPAARPQRHSFPTRRSSDLAEPHRLPALNAGVESARSFGLETVTLEVPAASPAASLMRALDIATERRIDALLVLRANIHVDRKSTRLNSSHEWISYAVFCLK